MRRLPVVFGIVMLAVSLIVTAGGTQEGKKDKDDKKETGKIKGQLPAGFKDLGLSKDQVLQVYKVQTEYNGKIKDLQSKIDELKKQRSQEEFKVLTQDQRKKYLEAKGVNTKDKGGEKKNADKKDADKKDADKK
jgi:TolA-binding protein